MKKIFAMMLCGALLVGCGSAVDQAETAPSSSVSSASESEFTFYPIGDFIFALPSAWTISEESENSVILLPREDKSIVVGLYVTEMEITGQTDDFLYDYASGVSEKHSNFEKSLEISGDYPLLKMKYVDSGVTTYQYVTFSGDNLISSTCMSKESIPADVQGFTQAMIFAVEGME